MERKLKFVRITFQQISLFYCVITSHVLAVLWTYFNRKISAILILRLPVLFENTSMLFIYFQTIANTSTSENVIICHQSPALTRQYCKPEYGTIAIKIVYSNNIRNISIPRLSRNIQVKIFTLQYTSSVPNIYNMSGHTYTIRDTF